MSARRRRRLWRSAGALAALAAAVVCALVVAVLGWRYPVEKLRPDRAASLTVVDRHGRLLRQFAAPAGGRARWVGLAELPPLAVAATLAGEDRGFYRHHGVDLPALARAAWLDLRAHQLAYGGSTLTMQLVRMVEPHPRTLLDKVGEAVRALRLERAVDKRTLLEQYLNRAYYGGGAWGLEAAAREYFDKPARQLSDGEAVLLAALPRAPAAYDPRRHLDRALARRHHLFALLVAGGVLDAAAAARAEAVPLALRAAVARPDALIADDAAAHAFFAPHFVDWVVAELPAEVRRRGGVVHTTLDRELQQRVEAALREHLAGLAEAHVDQAGLVVLDTRSGAVRAMVGSRDFFGPSGQINITTTPRNPGSALKPFTYALALEQGDTPASVAWDVDEPTSSWHTHNADGREHGPVRYRTALACSYNLAAVHVAESVGIGALLGRLRDGGLTTLDQPADHYGAALTLGAGPVRLVDLAAAYGFLVDAGRVTAPRAVERVDAPAAASWVPAVAAPRRLFSPDVSWLVMDMLADPAARRPAFGDDLPLDLPFAAAAKTGTSGGFSDNVTVIVTREYTAAAWAGNFDGTAMHNVLAMWGAAPLARAGLLAAADGQSLTLPPRPPSIVERPVCALSGRRPGAHCPVVRERFVAGHEPTAPCDWHRLDHGRVSVEWPAPVRAWAAQRRRAGGQVAD